MLTRVEPGLPIVIEVETEDQLEIALAAGATHLLVDNQSPAVLARWARERDRA
jgi:nicotinate-nucleotide pyrophosphorylase